RRSPRDDRKGDGRARRSGLAERRALGRFRDPAAHRGRQVVMWSGRGRGTIEKRVWRGSRREEEETPRARDGGETRDVQRRGVIVDYLDLQVPARRIADGDLRVAGGVGRPLERRLSQEPAEHLVAKENALEDAGAPPERGLADCQTQSAEAQVG